MPRLQPVWGMALKIYPYRRKHIMKKFLEEFKAFAPVSYTHLTLPTTPYV